MNINQFYTSLHPSNDSNITAKSGHIVNKSIIFAVVDFLKIIE